MATLGILHPKSNTRVPPSLCCSTGTLGVDKAHVENEGPTEGSKTNEEKPEPHGEGEEEDDGDSSGEEDEDETRHQVCSLELQLMPPPLSPIRFSSTQHAHQPGASARASS